MKSLVLFSATLAVALFANATAQAAHLDNPNQLIDPSFEGTITTDGAPFIGTWEGFSAGLSSTSDFTTTSPRTGAQSLEMNIGPDTNLFAGAFQDVYFGPALAGADAWFSGWHQSVGTTGGSEYRIEWRDSVGNVEVSRTQLTASPAGSGYEEFIIADTIPAGADTARLVYAIQSFGGALNQTVYVDDVNFNYVRIPEPTTALLALVGLAPLARRRR
ncbi:hypothetical protein Pla108_03360 [Botrimarina colliarenosi]|uniref:PEP-CTERM protein-sorting domain-containing protein n=1 Tax=Botrimarina colliarenosi TaxID=2528001 RepID=A0A5C6AIE1_9BACT|nr:hypothetical protein [Botrimarina colliarenosi]TWT99399.1 hypothetical protein Pla108_03360 [Botrimarina colliarenosi]